MSKDFRSIKHDLRKLSKQLDSNKGLMIKKTFDVTTSVYGHGHEGKPYMTVNARGDYKFSVFKLIVMLMFAFSTLALILLCLKEIAVRRRLKKQRGPKKRDEFYEEGWV